MPSRILVISTNRERAPQPTVPLGAAWVAESLLQAGFQVGLLDLCFARDALLATQNAIAAFAPDGIAISVRNLDNCNFLAPKSYLPEVRLLVDFIKSRSDARILVGGSGVSIMPQQVLDFLELDHAVVGEGEHAAPLFFRAEGAEHAGRVAGVVRRSKAGVVEAGGEAASAGPFITPRLHRWVETRRYLALEPVLPIQGKRGCAHRCLYCTYRSIEGDSWRVREPGAVVDEILSAMRNTRAREFEFVDSIFNEPEGYLETLLEEILRRGIKARFSVSSLSPKGLTRNQLQLMARAGVASAVITPESAAGATLAALGKGFDEGEVHRAAELVSSSRLRALWCFLLGGPSEDEMTLGKTVAFLNRYLSDKDHAFLTTGIRIYPGTGLHDVALRDGLVETGDDLLMPAFYFSPQLTPQQARTLLDRGISAPSRCINLLDTQAPVIGALRRIGTAVGLPTPYWRYTRFTKGMSRKR
ncbi:B12-binding domain-containing radical SAM protein [Geomonas edaphica]|uniref:B12-binding domain-containing radical SAM protein n=1 Tax=Geomonas edaphica TaxID=2570226 RepID=UPI0010A8B2AE|nr:cobalamin-dependent protein [Geomonas edaphica]